jgi:hypothetical protein
LNIVLYLGDGTFSGPGEYQLRAPLVGERHRFIIFLRQASPELAFSVATDEATRFGFSAVIFTRGGLIEPESLNSSHGFSMFYEEALSVGRSLVWYPNPVPQA